MWRFKSPFYLLGLYTTGSVLYKFGEPVYRYKYSDTNVDIADLYGNDKLAVVTGGTQGLGKGYVEELASRGFNLLLISRNEEKLNETKIEIENTYGVNVDYIPFDFSTYELEKYEELFTQLNKKNIQVLVNNAAVLKKGNLGEIDNKDLQTQVTANCQGRTLLVNNFLKTVKESDKESYKVLINIGSQSSNRGPILASYPYFATKQYQNYLTDCLTQEAEGIKKFYVQNNAPGFIDSPMLYDFSEKYKNPGFTQRLYIGSCRDIASSSLTQINNPLVNGTLSQALLNELFTLAPFTKNFLL